jgi:hypothetical protein
MTISFQSLVLPGCSSPGKARCFERRSEEEQKLRKQKSQAKFDALYITVVAKQSIKIDNLVLRARPIRAIVFHQQLETITHIEINFPST